MLPLQWDSSLRRETATGLSRNVKDQKQSMMHVNPFACTRCSDKAGSAYVCQTYRDEFGVFALELAFSMATSECHTYVWRYEEHLAAVIWIIRRRRQMRHPLTPQLPIARHSSFCVQLRLGGKAFHRNLVIRHEDFDEFKPCGRLTWKGEVRRIGVEYAAPQQKL